jgi:hypothetical protein
MPIGTFVIHYPKKMLQYFDKALAEQQDDLIQAVETLGSGEVLEKKTKFHARIYNLPVSSEITKGEVVLRRV